VVNPILPSLRDHDLSFILRDVACRAIFIPETFRGNACAEMLARVVADMDAPPEVFVLRGVANTWAGGHRPYAELFRSTPKPLPMLNPDAVRMIMYTSGTTGRPKGVMHTHNTLHALIRQLGQHWLIAPGDKYLVPSPISHIGGSIYAFEMPLLLGTCAVLMEKWDADEGVAIIDAQRITHLAGATPFLEALLAAARRARSRLPSLKVFICGGASVPPSLVREAKDYFQNAVVTRVYGSTEVPVTTVGVTEARDAHHAADTDGLPGIAEVKLAEDGEIVAQGPQMFVGYLHQEDEMGGFTDDGFYRTGDIGRWVDGDYLVVSGRKKDIIIRNGENIAPKEIEDLLIQHPDIADIAIVGLPDVRTGERACAVIVAANGAEPTVSTLRNFLEDLRVAKFKIPEEVALWDVLPRNDAGKVLKHVIRARLLEQG
jgi:acyl-CoA synthetase (AMP-forming)/AMP-acid ligase II